MLNTLALEKVNEIPEVLDLKSKRFLGVFNGFSQFRPVEYTATSVSNSSVDVSVNPPSQTDVIAPIFWKTYKFTVGVSINNGTGGNIVGLTGQSEALPSSDVRRLVAPRSFPISQITNTESVSINGFSLDTQLNEYNNCFIRFCNDIEDRAGEYSLTSSMLDENHKYEDVSSTFRDPFARYIDSMIRESRNAFSGCSYTTSDGRTVGAGATENTTFTFTVTEPCFVSPFWYQRKGITQVQTMKYSAQFSDLFRAVCAQPKNRTGTGVADPQMYTVTSVNLDEAKFRFYYGSPKITARIPEQLTYDYQMVSVLKSVPKTITAGLSDILSIPQLPLQSMPRRVIIWAEESKSAKSGATGVYKTDTFKSLISGLNIDFLNSTGILSSARAEDLYHLSKKNGLNMTYSQYSKYVGSAIALDFGMDIGLPVEGAPGVQSSPNFGVDATVKNISGVDVSFVLKAAVIYEGALNCINGTFDRRIQLLTPSEVMDVQREGMEMVTDCKCDNVFGGKIAGGNPMAILPFIGPIASMIRKGVQVGAPIAKTVADAAEKIGVGKGGKIAGKMNYGGKVLSRGDLMKSYEQE